jgi:hypothetical protein
VRVKALLYILGLLLPAILLTLAACSQGQPTQATTPALSTPPTSVPELQASSAIGPTPTPTQEPVRPLISVRDQRLEEDGLLTFDRIVTGDQTSWLAVHTNNEGQAGRVLGQTLLAAGEHRSVTVEVDPLLVEPSLYARLYIDAGRAGDFEFPGADRPLQVNAAPVFATFRVDVRAPVPALMVSDQTMIEEGTVVIDRVVAAQPGFLALQIDDGGRPGSILNFTPVPKGPSETISMTIPWREATPTLHAVLYEDGGQIGHFEPDRADRIVSVRDNPITASFVVRMPPDIFALPQPVVDGRLVVDRAVSYGPGWLVVYRDEDGQPDVIIGFARLDDGVNANVVISVTQSAVTDQLHLLLHEDTGDPGEFGFPATDPQVLFQGRMPRPVVVPTNLGNYVMVRDQALPTGNQVTIPVVALVNNAWLVIYTADGDRPGEMLGRTALEPGLHRNVEVILESTPTTEMVFAVLHVDASPVGSFDYPRGNDIPLQRNQNFIQVAFRLQSSLGFGE